MVLFRPPSGYHHALKGNDPVEVQVPGAARLSDGPYFSACEKSDGSRPNSSAASKSDPLHGASRVPHRQHLYLS